MKKSSTHQLREKTSIFGLFVLISLLLHLLAGLLLQHRQILPDPKLEPETIPIAMQERKNWLELDQKPQDRAAEPPEDATHLAEANQKVEQEAAPKGVDSRDQEAAEVQQQVAQQQPPPPQQPAPPSQPVEKPPSTPLQTASSGEQNPPTEQQPEHNRIPINLPNLTDLTQLSPVTLARIDQQQQRQRIKDRPEINLKDDEIWLNLQEMDNKLLSFFRRFSDRIEAVWNYPVEASSRGIQGTLLIKIVVNKKGELIDALPLQTSGSDILDYEAIQAVYRAAPFGPLPSYYKHDQLKIYAHFQYNLSKTMMYGRP